MGGYYARSIYAISDLKKLIHYKTGRGISLRWQGRAYSYLMTFCRVAHLEPLDVPENLPLVPVSAKATNETICRDLRITEKMVHQLRLETLRLDYRPHRQARFSRMTGRATWTDYLKDCHLHALEQRRMVEQLLNQGLTKSAIARKMHFSRKHIYHLINNEEVSSNGNDGNECQVQQG